MLQRLIYLSTKSELFKDSADILEQSVMNNRSNGISGILMEYENNFIQYLEGDAIEVYGLFKRIEKDDRHKDIWLVDYSPITERAFSEWGMGFKKLLKKEVEAWGLSEIKGFSNMETIAKNPEVLQLIQMIEFSVIIPDSTDKTKE
jgi:hypothetical protein